MLLSIKKIIPFALSITLLISCNTEETLQAYFVANQETENFISLDVPASFVNLDTDKLTKDQAQAYESVSKFNILAYTLSKGNEQQYNVELAKIQRILKNNRYQNLARGGNNTDGKFAIKYVGTDIEIEELIVFGNANQKGFVIVRVLGYNMKPEKLATLVNVIQEMNPDRQALDRIMNLF